MDKDNIIDWIHVLYNDRSRKCIEKYHRELITRLRNWYIERSDHIISFVRKESLIMNILPTTLYREYICTSPSSPSIVIQHATLCGIISLARYNEPETCCICIEIIPPRARNIVTLLCGHKFHFKDATNCAGLHQWLKNNHSCPCCRTLV